jgi:ribokinase
LFATLAAREFLHDVTLLAPVGNDVPPELIEAIELVGASVGTLPRRDLPTVHNIIRYAPDGSRTWELVTGEDHFDAMSVYPADVPESKLSADGILVCAMSLASQVALGPWLRKSTDAIIYLDLQEDYVAGNHATIFAMVAACDVFLPSEVEAVELAGTTDLNAAALIFRELGPQTIVIKRANKGCLVLAPGSDATVVVALDAVEPIDSTGAGDAFCGAFAAVHLITGDPVAAAYAGATSAIVAISGAGIDGLVRAARAAVTEGNAS